MPQISVDVDLYLIDSEDLIDEIIDRMDSKNRSKFTESEIARVARALKKPMDAEIKVLITTLNDKLKVEHFSKVFDKYSLEQLETLLPE